MYVGNKPNNNYVAMNMTAPGLATVFTNQISKSHTFAEVVSQCANISQQGVCKQTLTSARSTTRQASTCQCANQANASFFSVLNIFCEKKSSSLIKYKKNQKKKPLTFQRLRPSLKRSAVFWHGARQHRRRSGFRCCPSLAWNAVSTAAGSVPGKYRPIRPLYWWAR